jgi:hypothetical protein
MGKAIQFYSVGGPLPAVALLLTRVKSFALGKMSDLLFQSRHDVGHRKLRVHVFSSLGGPPAPACRQPGPLCRQTTPACSQFRPASRQIAIFACMPGLACRQKRPFACLPEPACHLMAPFGRKPDVFASLPRAADEQRAFQELHPTLSEFRDGLCTLLRRSFAVPICFPAQTRCLEVAMDPNLACENADAGGRLGPDG